MRRPILPYAGIAVACVALLFSAALAAPEEGSKVTVKVTHLAGRKGKLLASIFVRPDGFPSDFKKAFQSQRVVITNKTIIVTFTNVPSGKCAVGICHDENGNGVMDAGLLGRPKEGYGVSMTPKRRLGPPLFKDAVFDVSTQNVEIAIEMMYP